MSRESPEDTPRRDSDGDGDRLERDALGEVAVPANALYGAQTARAVANFPISGQRMPRAFLRALGLVKWAAATANAELGLLDPRLAAAIGDAANQVADGKLDEHFPVDVYQTGSGTSTNMNANEVIANAANLALGAPLGKRAPIHPNDHVNLGQSSNDVIPTATHVAAATDIRTNLLPALERLEHGFNDKGTALRDVVKIGRTHLQDATPIRLEQVFAGYGAQVRTWRREIDKAFPGLQALALGGTAVGTGLNTHERFAATAIGHLAQRTGIPFRETDNHVAAQAGIDAVASLSGALRGLATALSKIANDIRWLASGPRLGLGELSLPALQPGSSIMPGKINPVIAESLILIGARVVGADATIGVCALSGNFELNTMQPLIAATVLEQIALLSTGSTVFCDKLVVGLDARRDNIAERNERSLALATALVPYIGYDSASDVAKAAFERNCTVREIVEDRRLLPSNEIDRVFDLARLTHPGLPDGDKH